MKLKCIGGPCDDEWYSSQHEIRMYDLVRVPEKQATASMFNPYIAQSLEINYHIYVIDCFNFSKDDVYYFLRHEKLTNKEAMLHQFSKKCLQNYK
jgi:hypothetical protein